MVLKASGLYGLVLLVLVGCASASQADLAKPVPPGQARFVVYRNDGVYESLQWVPVTLNGREVGGAGPDAVFSRDVPPGSYRVSVLSQALWPGQTKTVAATAGETIYVKIGVFQGPSNARAEGFGTGPIFVPEIMNPAVARRELGELSHAAALM